MLPGGRALTTHRVPVACPDGSSSLAVRQAAGTRRVEENESAGGKWIPAAYGQYFPPLTGATTIFIEEALFFSNPVLHQPI